MKWGAMVWDEVEDGARCTESSCDYIFPKQSLLLEEVENAQIQTLQTQPSTNKCSTTLFKQQMSGLSPEYFFRQECKTLPIISAPLFPPQELNSSHFSS